MLYTSRKCTFPSLEAASTNPRNSQNLLRGIIYSLVSPPFYYICNAIFVAQEMRKENLILIRTAYV